MNFITGAKGNENLRIILCSGLRYKAHYNENMTSIENTFYNKYVTSKVEIWESLDEYAVRRVNTLRNDLILTQLPTVCLYSVTPTYL
jgi:hypothetical protein